MNETALQFCARLLRELGLVLVVADDGVQLAPPPRCGRPIVRITKRRRR